MVYLSSPQKLIVLGITLSMCLTLNAATSFRVLYWSGDLNDVFFQDSGGKMQELDAGKRSFSDTYIYPGEPPLRFYSKSVAPETGEELFLPVAELNPIPNFQTIGLLFFDKPGGGYRLYSLDIGAEQLPGGSFCFVNMTQRKLAFQVGETTFYLNPGQNHHFETSSDERPEDVDEDATSGGKSIIVRAAEDQSDGWSPVLNVRWMLSRTARTFVFVYNRDDGEIAMRRFSDRL